MQIVLVYLCVCVVFVWMRKLRSRVWVFMSECEACSRLYFPWGGCHDTAHCSCSFYNAMVTLLWWRCGWALFPYWLWAELCDSLGGDGRGDALWLLRLDYKISCTFMPCSPGILILGNQPPSCVELLWLVWLYPPEHMVKLNCHCNSIKRCGLQKWLGHGGLHLHEWINIITKGVGLFSES